MSDQRMPVPDSSRDQLFMRRHLRWVLAAVGLLNVLTYFPDMSDLVRASATIDRRSIEPELGVAFRTSLADYEYRGLWLKSNLTTWKSGLSSSLVLYEDGRPLEPASAFLAGIRQRGGGAYSHRGPTLVFSTSDNSDPRTNGRVYRVTYPLYLQTWVKLGVLSVTALALWIGFWRLGREERLKRLRSIRSALISARLREGTSRRTELTALCILAAAVLAVNYVVLDVTRSLPCLSPDSAGYLKSSVLRTAGYPLFLDAFLGAVGDARWLVPAQLNLLLVSFGFLGWAAGRVLRAPLAGMVIALSLFASKPLLFSSWSLLSEALFVPLVCAHGAAALLLLHTKSRLAALAAGITMGLAISVRPAGYSLLCGLPLLLWFVGSDWKRMCAPLLGGVAVVLVVSAATQYARFGIAGTQSIGGLALLGHVAPIVTTDVENHYPALTGRIAERIQPLTQDFETLSFPREHWERTTGRLNILLWENMVPEIRAYVLDKEPGLGPAERDIQTNAIAMEIATSAIFSRPAWYAKHVLSHYAGLWVRFTQDYVPLRYQAARCQQQTIRLLQKSPQAYAPSLVPAWYTTPRVAAARSTDLAHWMDVLWDAMPFFKEPMVLFAFLSTLTVTLGIFVSKPRSPRTKGLAYLAVILHTNLAFVAFVQSGLERYTQPLRPLVIVTTVGLVVLLIDRMARELAKQRQD